MLTEENVTIAIVKKLKENGWKILSFDYPQSGTGIMIKPDLTEKNLGGFIPDIVSIKNGTVLFWENKDRFVYEDFIKIKQIKNSKSFINPIKDFLRKTNFTNIYFGVAIPKIKTEIEKASPYFKLIDFFVVTDSKNLDIIYGSNISI